MASAFRSKSFSRGGFELIAPLNSDDFWDGEICSLVSLRGSILHASVRDSFEGGQNLFLISMASIFFEKKPNMVNCKVGI